MSLSLLYVEGRDDWHVGSCPTTSLTGRWRTSCGG